MHQIHIWRCRGHATIPRTISSSSAFICPSISNGTRSSRLSTRSSAGRERPAPNIGNTVDLIWGPRPVFLPRCRVRLLLVRRARRPFVGLYDVTAIRGGCDARARFVPRVCHIPRAASLRPSLDCDLKCREIERWKNLPLWQPDPCLDYPGAGADPFCWFELDAPSRRTAHARAPRAVRLGRGQGSITVQVGPRVRLHLCVSWDQLIVPVDNCFCFFLLF